MEPRGNAQVVNAYVPLSEMFGYATSLRSNATKVAVLTLCTSITMLKFQNQSLKILSRKIKVNNITCFDWLA